MLVWAVITNDEKPLEEGWCWDKDEERDVVALVAWFDDDEDENAIGDDSNGDEGVVDLFVLLNENFKQYIFRTKSMTQGCQRMSLVMVMSQCVRIHGKKFYFKSHN